MPVLDFERHTSGELSITVSLVALSSCFAYQYMYRTTGRSLLSRLQKQQEMDTAY